MRVQYKIVDTNIFLTDPNALFAFKPKKKDVKNIIVIPVAVINELDGFKKEEHTERGYNARRTINKLIELKDKYEGSFVEGIKIDNNYEIRISSDDNFREVNKKYGSILRNDTDGRILKLGLKLAKENDVEIITNDGAMQLIGSSLELNIKPWEAYSPVKTIEEVYKGWREVWCDSRIIEEFAHNHNMKLDPDELNIRNPKPNEYFILRGYDDKGVCGECKFQDNHLVHLQHYLNKKRTLDAKNHLQKFLMDALRDEKINLVFAIGSAGTGKTLLSLEAAITQTLPYDYSNPLVKDLERFKKDNPRRFFEKILVLRPAIGTSEDENPGFLPGDLDKKLEPFAKPVYDNLELILDKMRVAQDEREVFVEAMDVESFYFIRGRNIRNTFFLIDEAQNTTIEKMLTCLLYTSDAADE